MSMPFLRTPLASANAPLPRQIWISLIDIGTKLDYLNCNLIAEQSPILLGSTLLSSRLGTCREIT